MVTGMVYLGLWKGLLKRKVFSTALNSDRGQEGFHRMAGSEFQTDGAMKVNKHLAKDLKLSTRKGAN